MPILTIKSYIHAARHFHLRGSFAGCCFIPTDVFTKLCSEYVGRDTGQWVFPLEHIHLIADKWKDSGDIARSIEDTLNFEIPHKEVTLCVLKKNFTHIRPILPTVTTPGANEFWVPGGYTASGVPEIIIPRIRTSEYKILHVNRHITPYHMKHFLSTIH